MDGWIIGSVTFPGFSSSRSRNVISSFRINQIKDPTLAVTYKTHARAVPKLYVRDWKAINKRHAGIFFLVVSLQCYNLVGWCWPRTRGARNVVNIICQGVQRDEKYQPKKRSVQLLAPLLCVHTMPWSNSKNLTPTVCLRGWILVVEW